MRVRPWMRMIRIGQNPFCEWEGIWTRRARPLGKSQRCTGCWVVRSGTGRYKGWISAKVFRRLCRDELCGASSKQEACYLLGNLLALIKKLGSLGTATVRADFYQEGAFPHSAYDLL